MHCTMYASCNLFVFGLLHMMLINDYQIKIMIFMNDVIVCLSLRKVEVE